MVWRRAVLVLCLTASVSFAAGVAPADAPAAAPAWTVTTLAGNGRAGFRDGTGTKEGTAEFNGPVGVACDGAGNVYVADDRNHAIRRIGPDGTTTTVAGNGAPGLRDGVGRQALLHNPRAVAVGPDGAVYIADTGNNRIRRLAPDARVTTLAGTGRAGFADGPGARAELNGPAGLVVDADGVVYVADTLNHRIRRIRPDGTVTTLAGNGRGDVKDGTGGAGSTASFFFPDAITLGPDRTLYVRDGRAEDVRLVAADGTTTTPGGFPVQIVVRVGMDFPMQGVAVVANGNLLLSNEMWINQMIRGVWKSEPAAGLTAHGFNDGSGDRETGTADFDRVTALARCPDGSIVAADTGNNSIRRLSPEGPPTLAGPDPWAGLGGSEPTARNTRAPNPPPAGGLRTGEAHLLAPTLALDHDCPVIAWIESTPQKASPGALSIPERRSLRVTRWSGTRWIELPPATRWPEHSAWAEDGGGLVPANGPSLALDGRGQPMVAWLSDWRDIRIAESTGKNPTERWEQKKGGRWVAAASKDVDFVATSGEGQLHVRRWDDRARAWRTLPDPTLLLTEGDSSEDSRSVSTFQLTAARGGEPILAVTLGATIRVVQWGAGRWHELVGDDQRVAVDGADPGLALAVDGAGRPVLAFLGFDGVAHARRWSGARWDDLPELPMPTFRKHRDLRLAIDGAGAPLLATTTLRPASDEEYAPLLVFVEVHRLTEKGWVNLGSPSHPVLKPSSHYAFHPALAVDAHGEPVVAWQENIDERMSGLPWENPTPDSAEIYLRRWNGERWQELSGSATAGGVSNTVSPSGSPEVAVGKGTVCVSWQDRPRRTGPWRRQEPTPQELLRCHAIGEAAHQ